MSLPSTQLLRWKSRHFLCSSSFFHTPHTLLTQHILTAPPSEYVHYPTASPQFSCNHPGMVMVVSCLPLDWYMCRSPLHQAYICSRTFIFAVLSTCDSYPSDLHVTHSFLSSRSLLKYHLFGKPSLITLCKIAKPPLFTIFFCSFIFHIWLHESTVCCYMSSYLLCEYKLNQGDASLHLALFPCNPVQSPVRKLQACGKCWICAPVVGQDWTCEVSFLRWPQRQASSLLNSTTIGMCACTYMYNRSLFLSLN